MKKLMVHTGLAVSVVLGAFTAAQAQQGHDHKDFIDYPTAQLHLHDKQAAKALPANADKNIGILFLYTKKAKEFKGMPYLIDNVKGQTKAFADALQATGSDLTVSIVGIEPFEYDIDIDSMTLSKALKASIEQRSLWNISLPGLWPTKMQAMGADKVVLIKGNAEASGNACGWAYIAPSKSFFDNVNNNTFLHVQHSDCHSNIMAHEIGHELGGRHTSEEASSSFVPYAAPHRCGKSTTLMSPNVPSEPNGYSNPSKIVDGAPCGNADTADMARVMREHAPYMAAKSNTVSISGSKHSFVEKRHEAQEGSGSVTLTVKRDKTEKETTVYLTASSTTASSSEYSLSKAELVFPVGVDQLTVDLKIVDDSVAESDETVTVTLNPLPPYAVQGENPSVDVVIKNDDKAPTVVTVTPNSGGGGSTGVWLLLAMVSVLFARKVKSEK